MRRVSYWSWWVPAVVRASGMIRTSCVGSPLTANWALLRRFEYSLLCTRIFARWLLSTPFSILVYYSSFMPRLVPWRLYYLTVNKPPEKSVMRRVFVLVVVGADVVPATRGCYVTVALRLAP